MAESEKIFEFILKELLTFSQSIFCVFILIYRDEFLTEIS